MVGATGSEIEESRYSVLIGGEGATAGVLSNFFEGGGGGGDFALNSFSVLGLSVNLVRRSAILTSREAI